MEVMDQWRDMLEKTLEYYAGLPYPYDNMQTYVIVSGDRNHFFLMHEGWHGNQRIHGMVGHAEIWDSKIWMHYDGIEGSITEELFRAGVPKENIVLAFHPLYVREQTGYAIA